MNKKYHPKGSMCANCQNVGRYCAFLRFDKMPVMVRDKDSITVKCTEFLANE